MDETESMERMERSPFVERLRILLDLTGTWEDDAPKSDFWLEEDIIDAIEAMTAELDFLRNRTPMPADF